jgi:hypothetical protein
MDKGIIELSSMLHERALLQAECFPVDRYFLQQYIDDILSFDKNEFILHNLESCSNTYTAQLFLCLPELWEDISVDEILEISKKFTNIFSYYTLIEFTHRYIEINIIELLVQIPSLPKKIKDNIVDYLITSFYPNLIKTEGDYLFFKEGLYGVKEEVWLYIKQRLLIDKRIKPAITSVEEMAEYVKLLR